MGLWELPEAWQGTLARYRSRRAARALRRRAPEAPIVAREHPHNSVPCPSCSAPPGQSCRTIKTRRVTDTHSARIVRYAEWHGHPATQPARHLRIVR